MTVAMRKADYQRRYGLEQETALTAESKAARRRKFKPSAPTSTSTRRRKR
jgi:hypothetical protein